MYLMGMKRSIGKVCIEPKVPSKATEADLEVSRNLVLPGTPPVLRQTDPTCLSLFF